MHHRRRETPTWSAAQNSQARRLRRSLLRVLSSQHARVGFQWTPANSVFHARALRTLARDGETSIPLHLTRQNRPVLISLSVFPQQNIVINNTPITFANTYFCHIYRMAKIVYEARIFIKFECKGIIRMLSVGTKYSTHDLICDIINYASAFGLVIQIQGGPQK